MPSQSSSIPSCADGDWRVSSPGPICVVEKMECPDGHHYAMSCLKVGDDLVCDCSLDGQLVGRGIELEGGKSCATTWITELCGFQAE